MINYTRHSFHPRSSQDQRCSEKVSIPSCLWIPSDTNRVIAGDAMVREIDLSRITVRLVERSDKDNGEEKHVLGKLSGELVPVLSRCLYTESELNIGSGKIKVLMKYLPIKMQLDPSESMNNMGTLRVDVFDGKGLPAADKNGFSDPYCKFKLNEETVHKTKICKKTLNPVWEENFETPIQSRTASKFKVKVYDWDQFGDDDYLGEADIDLAHLDPMQTKNVQLKLHGENGTGSAGIINLRLLFKAAYVTRSRQGSSTFSASMGNAGKVVGAPVKVVGMVGSGVGGGLAKGASFMKHGFKGSKDTNAHGSTGTNGYIGEADAPVPSIETPQRSAALSDVNGGAMSSPRAPSIGGMSVGGGPGPVAGDHGTANISVISARGYPSDTKIQVIIKAIGGKKSKELIKTKPLKNSGPDSNLTWEGESTKHTCAPDTQFQVVVEDHGLFGGKDLGEALFFLDDSAVGGSERSVKVGPGTVVVRSGFTRSEGSIVGSAPTDSLKTHRRSFMSRSRGSTPS